MCDQVGDHDPLVNVGGGVRAPCSDAGDASSGVYTGITGVENDRDVNEACSGGLNAVA